MIFGPQKVTVWVVASHKVGEQIEMDMYISKAEAKAAFDAIDIDNEPLMDCKQMMPFNLVGEIGWGGKQRE